MTSTPLKDEEKAHPIAEVWRPTIRQIVKALAEGDYEIARGIKWVTPPNTKRVKQMRSYVADFGETLTELSDETWDSSVSQWMETHWDVLVDLWTVESGRSDLALSLRIFEAESGYRFELDSLHVP